MNTAIIYSRGRRGLDAPLITVEVHLSGGLPRFSIVGLPETAVRESRDRVRSALLTNHFRFPSRRITVSLAPADLRKEGTRFDLAVALGILAASEQLPGAQLEAYEFIGELSLTGILRPLAGILPAVIATSTAGRCLLLPTGNRTEAALYPQSNFLTAENLLQVCAHLAGTHNLQKPRVPPPEIQHPGYPNLSEVLGQESACRALEIAAAGSHNLLFIGPPGSGKTMLAQRLPGILPAMTELEALESGVLRSLKTSLDTRHWGQRPFRAPHHSASAPALVGGGSILQPGEISLAHHGVLFLDELPEFKRSALEVLREPLESGEIHLARARDQVVFPSRFQLIAAMNPCPCGFLGSEDGSCRCSLEQIRRYRARVSGPLLDRIDLHIAVPRCSLEFLQGTGRREDSKIVRQRVVQAHAIQMQRCGKNNNRLGHKELERFCPLDAAARRVLEQAARHLKLSVRALQRLRRVARTIADLEGADSTLPQHLREAVSLRRLAPDLETPPAPR